MTGSGRRSSTPTAPTQGAHEAELRAVDIVTAKAHTAEELAGKQRVIAREMFDEDEMVRLILNADAERIAAR